MRLFEEGRSINPEAARRAASAALESPNLHEAKRKRLEEALAPEKASRFDLREGIPVALGEDAIVLRDAEQNEVSIPDKEVEAVAVAEVSGLAAFLGELLERTRANCLPRLESALGVQFARFDSLAEYEREVLSVAWPRSDDRVE